MAFETTEGGGFMVTGERDTRTFQLLALRKAIQIEMRTGLKMRGNPRATVAVLAGTPGKRLTNKSALAALEKMIGAAEDVLRAEAAGKA